MEAMTRDEARHLLRTLPFDDWLMAAVLFPPRTTARRRLRSLEELVLMFTPNEKMFPSVKLERVVAWVDRKVGDRRLASELEAIATDERGDYMHQCYAFYEKMAQRYDTLKKVAGEYDA